MFSSSQLVVGVDIGSHSVKICQLKRTDKAYSIVTIGSAILPEGAVDDGALVEPEVVASAISNLFKNLKIKHKKVGISISGYSVIVVNPYYRTATGQVLPEGKTFRDPGVRDLLMPHARSLSPETCVTDGRALVKWLDSQPSVDPAAKVPPPPSEWPKRANGK